MKIETLLTVGIIGAVGIIGYALYRNAGKIGTVVSSGVEKTLTDPLSNYLDSLSGNVATSVGGTSIPDPNKPAFGLLPEAIAQTPTGDVGITPQEGTSIEQKYGPKAQESAKLILQSFAPSSQEKLITSATLIAEQSPTPITTQAYSIIDAARVSVGGAEPLTNKFYRLFTFANKPYDPRVLPLSREAVQAYAKVGVIAREVYL